MVYVPELFPRESGKRWTIVENASLFVPSPSLPDFTSLQVTADERPAVNCMLLNPSLELFPGKPNLRHRMKVHVKHQEKKSLIRINKATDIFFFLIGNFGEILY